MQSEISQVPKNKTKQRPWCPGHIRGGFKQIGLKWGLGIDGL